MANYFVAHDGKTIRFTAVQRSHIAFFHPEVLDDGENNVGLTLREPDIIAEGATRDTRISYKFFKVTPVTSKFMAVVVKVLDGEGFIITAYYAERAKRKKIIWKRQS